MGMLGFARRWLVLVLVLPVMVIAAQGLGAGTATTYYVSPRGSDAAAGTSEATPWRTLAHALAAPLGPGDRVLLEGGEVFAETLAPWSTTAGTADAPIEFGSYGSGRATLARGVYLSGTPYLTLSGLTVTNTGAGAKGIFSSSGGAAVVGLRIDDVIVEDVGGFGIVSDNPADVGWVVSGVTVRRTGDSGMLFRGSDVTVTGSTLAATGTDTTITHPRHGIYAAGSRATIVGNTITGSSTSGISFRREGARIERNRIAGGTSGIAYSPEATVAGTAVIVGNTVAGVTDYGIGSATAQSLTGFVVAGNTVASDGPWGMYFQAGPSLTLANNVVTGSPTTAYLNVRPQTAGYAESHDLFWGSALTGPFTWNGTARTLAEYAALSGGGGADRLADPQLDTASMPASGSPAVDAGTAAVAGVAVAPACDGAPGSWCGLAPDIGAVERPLPTPIAPPVIGGSTVVGETMTASIGTWAGPDVTTAVTWERCDASGAGCAPIADAVGVDHVLVAADAGSTLRAVVSATNPYGTIAARSAASSLVSAPVAALHTYRDAVTASAPAGFWRLAEATGAVAGDASGHGLTGTYAAAGVAYGAPGALSDGDPAVSLSGALGGSVDLGDVLDAPGTAPFTLEAWVRPTTLDRNGRVVVAKQDAGLDGVALAVKANAVTLTRRRGKASSTVSCGARIPVGAWTHLAATYDGAAMTVYVGGTACARASSTVSLLDIAGHLRIGRGAATTASTFFDGGVDEVAVYRAALPVGAIQAHVAAR